MTLRELISTDRPRADAQRALHGHFTLRAGSAVDLRRVYLDTFDRRLRAKGFALYRVGERRTLMRYDGMPIHGASVTGAGAVDGGLAGGDGGPAGGGGLAGGTDLTGGRELAEIAELTLSEQTLDVLDERQKIVCRIVVEVPAVLRSRVRLAGLRGYAHELRRIHQLLLADLGFQAATLPLADEAVLAAGGDPAGASLAVTFHFTSVTPAELAVLEVLRRLAELIAANLPGVLAGDEPEFLHDYRVSIRRTRAVIRQLRGVLPAQRLPELRSAFRRLQDATSQTRDLEVFLSEFEQLRELVPTLLRADLDPLRDVLRAWRAASREHMERELTGERARRLRAQWDALLAGLPELSRLDRPDAERPIGALAGRRVRVLHRRMVRIGGAIGPDTPPQAYHELRKQAKELRYLLELFAAPLYPPVAVQRLIVALKALQDTLGEHQDRVTQAETLKRVSEQVLTRSPDGTALLAMGALAERLDARAQAARARFATSFRGFASEAQCKLVSRTFR